MSDFWIAVIAVILYFGVGEIKDIATSLDTLVKTTSCKEVKIENG